MAKPADIPQDVWDAAVETANSPDGLYVSISRAIMAATERAALIAQGWKPPKQDITEPTKLYRPFDVSDAIAAEIRNGAQPPNAIPIIGTIGK